MTFSNFVKMVEKAAKDQPPIKPVILVRQRVCQICLANLAEECEQSVCSDCQAATERGYQISELAGRCRSGGDRAGTRWHARFLIDGVPSFRAACGYAPKGSSAGWSYWRPEDRTVTCPKCLKKLDKAERIER